MKKTDSLSELINVIPSGKNRKKEDLKDVSLDTLRSINSVSHKTINLKESLDQYPRAKDDAPLDYWVVEFPHLCAKYSYKSVPYTIWYRWITYEQIKEALETLDVKPFKKEYEELMSRYNSIMEDQADDYSKMYRLKELREDAGFLCEDLEKFSREIYENHKPLRDCINPDIDD